MKTIVMSAVCAFVLFVACNKKEPQVVQNNAEQPRVVQPAECGKEVIADKPVKVGETGILLPVGTRICLAADHSEIRVELPKDYSFAVDAADGIAARPLPIGIATYHCICSGGGACQVAFIDELGFGCMHSNCSGGCTGAFIYKGYSVNRVINLSDTKDELFGLPDVQESVRSLYESKSITEPYSKETLYGVSFYIVRDEKAFLAKASCDCEGTKACTLKVKELSLNKAEGGRFKIYYCDGACNGCELTVN